jgi:hypothetical protein
LRQTEHGARAINTPRFKRFAAEIRAGGGKIDLLDCGMVVAQRVEIYESHWAGRLQMVQTSWTNQCRAESFVTRRRPVLCEKGEFKWVTRCQGDNRNGVPVRRKIEPGPEIGGAGAPHRDARRRYMEALRWPSS